MKNIYIFISVILACMLFSCSKDGEMLCGEDSSRMPLKINFNLPSESRANDAGFAAGDKCGVYVTEYNGEQQTPLQVSGNYVNNALFTFDEERKWTSENVFWSEGKMDIYAYYPYSAASPSSVDEYRFSVALDQSASAQEGNLSGYEASDFLWACKDGVVKEGSNPSPVEMTFSHRMSKLIVVLAEGESFDGKISDYTDGAKMYVHNTVADAVIDLATGSVSKYIFASPQTITCRKVDEARFEAIIVPQRIATRRPFLELVSDDLSLLAESDFNFKEGAVYTVTLTLNRSKDQTIIDIGGEVSDWIE